MRLTRWKTRVPQEFEVFSEKQYPTGVLASCLSIASNSVLKRDARQPMRRVMIFYKWSVVFSSHLQAFEGFCPLRTCLCPPFWAVGLTSCSRECKRACLRWMPQAGLSQCGCIGRRICGLFLAGPAVSAQLFRVQTDGFDEAFDGLEAERVEAHLVTDGL